MDQEGQEGQVVQHMIHDLQNVNLNITWQGQNGDLPDKVSFDVTEGDVKQIATEAVQTGYVPGITIDPEVDFQDFVVERFEATEELPPRIFLRAKTEFGVG